jgi:hypothetical protein
VEYQNGQLQAFSDGGMSGIWGGRLRLSTDIHCPHGEWPTYAGYDRAQRIFRSNDTWRQGCE